MGSFFKYAATFVAGVGVGVGVKYGYDKYHETDTPCCEVPEAEDPRDEVGDPPDVEEA
nr:MAG TPA: hypothetical protein [Caudoviricetes sp.]